MARYLPVTRAIAFIEAPFDVASDAALEWYAGTYRRSGRDWTVTRDDCPGSFEEKMRSLLPLMTVRVNKWLLIETADPAWCAWFGNAARGNSDVRSGSEQIGKLLRTRVVDIIATRDVPGGQPGSMQFRWIDWSTEPKTRRYIASHRESRWEFEQSGSPLPFEELDAYEARRIKDRLTLERLDRYCRHLGIHPFDPAFYEGRGTILNMYTPPNSVPFDRFPNAPDLTPRPLT